MMISLMMTELRVTQILKSQTSTTTNLQVTYEHYTEHAGTYDNLLRRLAILHQQNVGLFPPMTRIFCCLANRQQLLFYFRLKHGIIYVKCLKRGMGILSKIGSVGRVSHFCLKQGQGLSGGAAPPYPRM